MREQAVLDETADDVTLEENDTSALQSEFDFLNSISDFINNRITGIKKLFSASGNRNENALTDLIFYNRYNNTKRLRGNIIICNGSEPDEFKWGVSEQRATELLRNKASEFIRVINNSVKVPLNQNQFDSLVSFVYNIGARGFQSSTLLKQLNNSNYNAVPIELRKWIKAGGQLYQG
jgi:GH24 family phage-related lysozyme (muramidase)